MAASDIIIILLNPWLIALLWEPLIVFLYVFTRILKPFGKFKAVRFKNVNNVRIAVSPRWVPLNAEFFSPKKDETHIVEEEGFAYFESDAIGSHPVAFFDIAKSRALRPTFEETAKSKKDEKEKGKALKLKLTELKHNPAGKGDDFSLNPSSADVDDLLARKTLAQLVASKLLGHPNLLLIALCVGLGVGIGWIAQTIINPAHITFACPPQDTCTAPQTTGTSTTVITG